MDFRYSASNLTIKKMTSNFGIERLTTIPEASCRIEMLKSISREVKEYGFLSLPIPSEYNGFDCDATSLFIALEEMARHSIDAALFVLYNNLAIYSLLLSGSDTQKLKYLISISDQEKIFAFCPSYEYYNANQVSVLIYERDNKLHLEGSCPLNEYQIYADYFIFLAKFQEKGSKRVYRLAVIERERVELDHKDEYSNATVKLNGIRIEKDDLLSADDENAIMITNQVYQMGLMDLTAVATGISGNNIDRLFNKNNIQVNTNCFYSKILAKFEGSKLLAFKAAYLKDQGLPFYHEATLCNIFSTKIALETSIKSNNKTDWEFYTNNLFKAVYMQKLSDVVLKSCDNV